MRKNNIPIHIRIMAALGIIQVTHKKPDKIRSSGILPKGFSNSIEPQQKSFSITDYLSNHIGLLFGFAIVIILLVTFYGVFSNSVTDTKIHNAQTLHEKAEVIAKEEEKNEWEKQVWDNPGILEKLTNLKFEIDGASCDKLGLMLDNERWTLRAYVAHTILEKKC